jgi:hypothetical protein
MADGTTKPIKDIKPGDEILATNAETGERAAKTVTAVWVHQDELVDLQLHADSDKDGKPDRIITTTEAHPFWNATDHQWQDAQQIGPGETLVTADGHLVPVTGIVWAARRQAAAYNLTVARTTLRLLPLRNPRTTSPARRLTPGVAAAHWRVSPSGSVLPTVRLPWLV